MSTIYKNLSGQIITKQQSERLKEYIKCFMNQGIQVRQEYFFNRELGRTKYYINSENEISNILTSDSNAIVEFNTVDGEYTLFESRSYKNNVLNAKSIKVQNLQGEEICSRIYSLIDSNLQVDRTQKFYYANSIELYSFDYKDDGTCEMINNQVDLQGDIFPHDIGDPVKTDFTWTGFEYYQFADPINPNDLIIV